MRVIFITMLVVFFAYGGYFNNIVKEHAFSSNNHVLMKQNSFSNVSKSVKGIKDSKDLNNTISIADGLEGLYWDQYSLSSADHGSNLNSNRQSFRPINFPKDWYFLGDVPINSKKGKWPEPNFPTLLLKDTSKNQDVLAKPIDWGIEYQLWGGNRMHSSINMINFTPPQGYSCLGMVAVQVPHSQGMNPKKDNIFLKNEIQKVINQDGYRCVKNNFVTKSESRIISSASWGEAEHKHMGATPQDYTVNWNIINPKWKQYLGSFDGFLDDLLKDKKNLGDKLSAGDVLRKDNYLISQNGDYVLAMDNCVLREYTNFQGDEQHNLIWSIDASRQNFKEKQECRAVMQSDGNFVIYEEKLGGSNKARWNTQTSSQGIKSPALHLQNDANLVLLDDTTKKPYWSHGNLVYDLIFSNTITSKENSYTALAMKTPEQQSSEVRYESSIFTVGNYSANLNKSLENNRIEQTNYDKPTISKSDYKQIAETSYGENNAKEDKVDSTTVHNNQNAQGATKTLPTKPQEIAEYFGLKNGIFSNIQSDRGTIKNNKYGYDEDYIIAKVDVKDLQFPASLSENNFKMNVLIDTKRRYSGELILMARNYHGKGTAYAGVFITDVVNIAKTSNAFQQFNDYLLSKASLQNQNIGISFAHLSWANAVKNKKIPGLKPLMRWDLQDMPDEYARIFASLLGNVNKDVSVSNIKKNNTQLIFQDGLGFLAGIDLAKVGPLEWVFETLCPSDKMCLGMPQIPNVLASLLPNIDTDMDTNVLSKLGAVIGVDFKMPSANLFKIDLDKLDDFASFDDQILQVVYEKAEVGKTPNVIGSINSWMNLKINDKYKAKAYTKLLASKKIGDIPKYEISGFIDGTLSEPFGLTQKGLFPDLRIEHPEVGGILGGEGWTLWVGGLPDFKNGEKYPIDFIRAGVSPYPPFVTFTELDLKETSLNSVAGAIASTSLIDFKKGLDKGFGLVLPLDKFVLGEFHWNTFRTNGPRIIYSTQNIDSLGIVKGVTAMGSLKLKDDSKELEIGQMQLMNQASGTVAARGEIKSFDIGILKFEGKKSGTNPMMDIYLTQNPSFENKIVFDGSIELSGNNRLDSYIKFKANENLEFAINGKLFNQNQLSMKASGSLLSLIDPKEREKLEFETYIKLDTFGDISKEITSEAKKLYPVDEVAKLVNGNIFNLESLMVVASPSDIKHNEYNFRLNGFVFGKQISIKSNNKNSLVSKTKHEIQEIAKDLLPNPFKFLKDLANDVKNLSAPIGNAYKNIIGNDPSGALSSASDAIDKHAGQAMEKAKQVEKELENTQKSVSKAAEAAKKAISDAAKALFNALKSLKFW